jgi:regulator of replication initiation timing
VEKNDEALEAKKVLIMDQIEIIQGKLQQIKSSAEQIQTQITRILEECMNTLMVEVQKKSAILKSDKIELSRQYKEIEFMTQFLNLQARQTSPIEFLQQYAAHNQLKSQL